MNIIHHFFEHLADRFWKENDLSDITWALCKSSPTFLKIWTTFFFPELENAVLEDIKREVAGDDGGSRVDFLIKVKGDSRPYLVEVKIGDTNHHFGQYDNAYHITKERLGYITNYPLKVPDYNVKQWREFYDQLVKLSQEDGEEKSLIKGYTEYLKKVCGIVMITERINLEKMTSLYGLTVLFRDLVKAPNAKYESSIWNVSNKDNVRWFYLRVKYDDFPEWNFQYPFVGICYDYPKPLIVGGFDYRSDYARTICNYIKENETILNQLGLKFCSTPYWKTDFCVKISDVATEKFNNAPDIEEQKKILGSFLDEMLSIPIKIADFKAKNSI